jgi:hypothetical protein
MKQRQRHPTAIFLLVLYIGTGPLAEVLHQHPLSTLSASRPQLMNHECGDKEIHVPLDGARPCAFCFQLSQRVSLPTTHDLPVPLFIFSVQSHSEGTELPVGVDYLFTGKRGPPAA